MVVLILVALWIVVLAPTLLKRYVDNKSTGSIDSFHQSLHLLERAGPKIVPPAYRLETAQSSIGVAVGQTGFPAVSSRPGRPNLVLLQPVADPESSDDEILDDAGSHYRRLPPADDPTPPEAPSTLAATFERDHRRQVQRRRRDVLIGLTGTLVVSLLLGIVPALHGLWIVSILAGIGLAGFAGLAVYAQLLETERRRGPRAIAGSSQYEHRPSGRAEAGYPGAWDDDGSDADAYETLPRAASH